MRVQSFSSGMMLACALSAALAQQHSHPTPETGQGRFRDSCSPQVGAAFNRGVALLHSFAYNAAEQQFRDVARADQSCAMAHWGIALSYYHPLWMPPDADQATQANILEQEAHAWIAIASGDPETAIVLMRAAANEEDAVEKLPVTPGPIVPAREQLGELLLASGKPAEALREFHAAMQAAPRRRGALIGAATAEFTAKKGGPRASKGTNF
jgi:hypothetical protein